MPKHLVYFAHGFLGQSSDWDMICDHIDCKFSCDLVCADFFSENSLDILEFEDYTQNLSESIEELELQNYQKRIFVGYSLGGRLGLHLLQNKPNQFDEYIFISTNPGYSDSEQSEKNKRLISDMKWAHQISEQNWKHFLKEWNAQNVFADSEKEPERRLQDFDLDKLKRALVMWSLSQQDDFRDLLNEFKLKITWVVGEKDAKYRQIAEDLKQKKILLDYKRISSGHRVWLDQPTEICQLIIEKLKS